LSKGILLIRKEAIKIVAEKISDSPIIAANGYLSRDLYEVCDKPSNFYMIGSMGLSSSIGLGLALKNRKKIFYIFDGDGNLLMNLGSLITIGVHRPKNLIHIVFDNSSHESTGGQPTESKNIQLDNVARSTKIKTFRVGTKNELIKILEKTKKLTGPILILVKISKSKKKSRRVNIEPIKIKSRFMKSLYN
jgi:thiamine pyrophosphate-dependent acetolactate synthase large subunit-like protein